jgi:hypothetical protein
MTCSTAASCHLSSPATPLNAVFCLNVAHSNSNSSHTGHICSSQLPARPTQLLQASGEHAKLGSAHSSDGCPDNEHLVSEVAGLPLQPKPMPSTFSRATSQSRSNKRATASVRLIL